MDDLSISEAFTILSLPETASNADIRKSYRQLSLRLHPDKAKDVSAEVASTRFDRLQKAYELVNDPVIRTQLLLKQKEESARKEKSDRFEAERKKMSQDLFDRERREEERKREQKRKERERWNTVQQLKEEGRKLREEAVQAKERELQSALNSNTTTTTVRAPSIGDMDTSVRLMYPSSLTSLSTSEIRKVLEDRFGPILHLTKNDTSSSSTKRKRTEETVLVATFESIESAFKCVELGGNFRLSKLGLGREWDEIWIEWYNTRSETKLRKKKKKEGDTSMSEYQREEMELIGCKVGEPLRVRYWRRYQRDKIRELLGGNEVGTGGTSSASFEEDVLKRAMSAGNKPSDPISSSTSFEADVLQRAMSAGNRSSDPAPSSSFEQDVLKRAMAAGKPSSNSAPSSASFEADVLQRAMSAGNPGPPSASFENDVLSRAMSMGQQSKE